jgi:hypothetical protein
LDAACPSAASWQKLKEAVGGNLIKVHSLFGACELDRNGAACLEAIKNVHNPYYIADQPGGNADFWLAERMDACAKRICGYRPKYCRRRGHCELCAREQFALGR